MVDSPSVKLLYDIYHMQIMEGDIIRTIRDHQAYFAHYHAAGNPGRHELDEAQELYLSCDCPCYSRNWLPGLSRTAVHSKSDPIAALKQAFGLFNMSL